MTNPSYTKLIERLTKNDPRLLTSDFEKNLDQALSDFQTELQIEEALKIRAANLVAFPLNISANGDVQQITGKPLPETITLKRIWDDLGSFIGLTKIDGKDYFINTAQLANHYTDDSANLIIAPFFEDSKNDYFNASTANIAYVSGLLQEMSQKMICKDGNIPHPYPETLNQTISVFDDFFKKFMVPESSDFEGTKISQREMTQILEAIKTLTSYGFSPKQLQNSSDLACAPHITDAGFISHQLLVEIQRFPFLAIHGSGKTSFRPGTTDVPGNSIILHETLHSLSDHHLDFYKVFDAIMKKGGEIPATILNAKYPPAVPQGDIAQGKLGALDACLILTARHLSYLNNGTQNYKIFSHCYEALNSSRPELLPTSLMCQDGSIPSPEKATTTTPTPTNILSIVMNQIQIEGASIGARTIAEITSNYANIDEKTREAVASTIENATRLTAIGLYYGPNSLFSSALMTSVTSSLPKILNSDQDLRRRFKEGTQNLVSCLVGRENADLISENVSRCYEQIPKPIKNMATQIAFISLIYSISEAFRPIEDPKTKQKTDLNSTILAGMLTSFASGLLRVASSLLVDKLSPSRTGRVVVDATGVAQATAEIVEIITLPGTSVEVISAEQNRSTVRSISGGI